MKALSLTEPWATLVVTGEKEFETRSWKTSHRGLIAIHASKGFPKDARELTNIVPFSTSLARHGIVNPELVKQMPLGAIIGTVEIVEIIPTHQAQISDKEWAFGDYSQNRFAWKLTNPRRLENPIFCRGALSLWNVPNEIEVELLSALKPPFESKTAVEFDSSPS